MTTSALTIIIVISVISILVMLKLYSDQDSQKQKIEELINLNKKLISKNTSLEANRLKFILQPHTLNNILAHLQAFSSKLNQGMDYLSENLEYIFYKGEDHFVTLEDEINFIKNYLKLNELFINEINAVQIFDSHVDTNSDFYRIKCIPHLITAYFLENAFKHGNLNHPEFLKLHLSLQKNRFEITVINKTRTNNRQNKKNGVGLENMKSRLELLMNGKFKISNSCDEKEYRSTLIIVF